MGRLTFGYKKDEKGNYVLTLTKVETGTKEDEIKIRISSGGNEINKDDFKLAKDADAGTTVAEAIFLEVFKGLIGNDGDNTKDLDFGDFLVDLDGASIIFKPKDDTNPPAPVIEIDDKQIKLSE